MLFTVFPGESSPSVDRRKSGTSDIRSERTEWTERFVIAPFQVSETCPVVLIQPDQWGQPLPIDNDTAEEREVALRMQGQESFLTSSTEEYASCFHTFINALRDNTLIN